MASTCPVCMAPLPEGENACPTCGFKLLGKTQAFKPIASDAQASASSPIFDEARLRIVRGPQVGNVFRLAADVITIGRSPQCDIFLNDMTVSRSHAEIRRVNGVFHIVDLDSFNGLWVNNRNVRETRLYDGDVIQIGTFSLAFSPMDPTR